MQWSDFFAAVALYFVLEGIVPFLNPQALKRALLMFTSLNDRQLRLAGLASMLVGMTLLYLVRA